MRAMGHLRRILAFILYYGVARHLPGSAKAYAFGSGQVRTFLGRGLLERVGRGANIEHGADFGTGLDIRLGDRSGLGVNCRVGGPLEIGDDVMMAPGVVILTQNHGFEDPDLPMID